MAVVHRGDQKLEILWRTELLSYCANFLNGNFSYLEDLTFVLLTMDALYLPVLRTSPLVVSIQSVQPKSLLNIRLYNINTFLAWFTYRFIRGITKYPEEISAGYLKSNRKVKLQVTPHIFSVGRLP